MHDATVQQLVDERAVTRVILRLGRAIDRGDWLAYRSCFQNRPLLDFQRMTGSPPVLAQADDWVRCAASILGQVRRHHTYSNIDVKVVGDRATAVWYMIARHWKATDLGGSIMNQIGWYEGEFASLADGTWRLSYLKHHFEWVEGNNSLFDMTLPEVGAAFGAVFNDANIAAAAEAGRPGLILDPLRPSRVPA